MSKKNTFFVLACMKGSDTSIQLQNQCIKKQNDSYQPPDDFYKVFAVKNLGISAFFFNFFNGKKFSDEKNLPKSMEKPIHFNVNPMTTLSNAKNSVRHILFL